MTRPGEILGAALLAATATSAAAQRGHLDAGYSRFHGPTGRRTVVRTAEGALLSLSTRASGALMLRRREPESKRWRTVQIAINDEASGVAAKRPANTCSLAIDSRGRLHVLWARYYYPRFFEQYYRRIDLATGEHSNVLPLTLQVRARTSTRTEAMAIAVDAEDTVWLAVTSSSNWRSQLMRSREEPNGEPEFESVGTISRSFSAQVVQLAVDSDGRVHCVYFTNRHPGPLVHRWYDPKKGWQPEVEGKPGDHTIAIPKAPNVSIPSVATDTKGRLHLSYVDRVAKDRYELRYRSFDVQSGWSDPVTAVAWPRKALAGRNPNHFHQVTCDEATGTPWLAFRDFGSGGSLVVHARGSGGGFHLVKELERDSSRERDYYLPNVRNTLFPPCNRMHGSIDLSYQKGDAPPFQLRSYRIDVSELAK